MPINTSWRVRIGPVATSPTLFTDRVMGMSINQQVDVNEIGRGICTLTLLNKDGALTPGGGGTYSSTDWFAQGVYVQSVTNIGGADTFTTVFEGVIVDFDLTDDGVYSTVTITALDGLTVAAKTVGSTIGVGGYNYKGLYDSLVDATGIVFPRLGASTAAAAPNYEWSANLYGLSNSPGSTISPTTYADALQTYLIPSANDVTWATSITYVSFSLATLYGIRSLGPETTRSEANRWTFTFDPSNSITGTDLPFSVRDFQQAFNNDTLINQAQVRGVATGLTTQTSTNASNTSYGNRTVQFLSTLNETDTQAQTVATRLTNRYSTSRFTPVSLRVTASMVKARCANAAQTTWEALLGISSGIWQRTKITWSGSGASSQTAYCVIKGRRIDVTPQDTVVTLTLGNWADNHSFILDTDQLDVDRLG